MFAKYDRVIYTPRHWFYLRNLGKFNVHILRENYSGTVSDVRENGLVTVIWPNDNVKVHFPDNLEQIEPVPRIGGEA